VQHDFGAVAPGGGDLGRRRVFRHANDRANAVNLCCERHALRVIPRRRANDAAPFLLFGHQRELVQGPSDLVRADALEELGFQPHIQPGAFGELPRRQQRGVLDVLCNAGARFLEIVKRQSEHVSK
jgi:hypothetical protein